MSSAKRRKREPTTYTQFLADMRRLLATSYALPFDHVTETEAAADKCLLDAALVPLDAWLAAHPMPAESENLGRYAYTNCCFMYDDVANTLINWGADSPFEVWLFERLKTMESGFADCAAVDGDRHGLWLRYRRTLQLIMSRFKLTDALEDCIEAAAAESAEPPEVTAHENQWSAYEYLLGEMALQTGVWSK